MDAVKNHSRKINNKFDIFTNHMEFRILNISVAIIINAKNKLLIVQKESSTYYQLPGGKIENGELPIEALKRELLEELDLDISNFNVRNLGTHQTQAVNEVLTNVNGHIFQIELDNVSFEILPKSELRAVHWLSVDEVSDFKLANLLKEIAIPVWFGSHEL